jgi:hypothetical protein
MGIVVLVVFVWGAVEALRGLSVGVPNGWTQNDT